MRYSNPNFSGLQPATFETFAEVTRRRVYQSMACMIKAHRQQDTMRVWRYYGEARSVIGVLYDMGHPSAYHIFCRMQTVCEKIL